MKRLIILIGLLLLFINGDTQVAPIDFHGDIETRSDFWKSHAYVELKLMSYRVNKIINN